GDEVDRRQAAEVRADTAATEVVRKDQDLSVANQRLTAALDEARRAAQAAQAAREEAEAEAARAQRAEQAEREKQAALQQLLDEREARVHELELQLKKISTVLR
ncbi:MAG TPA: hypothetical protein VHE35_14565, partial [Kofleriaceae bacterium]|nr:hypothetical protein [Kofleriaceae bacterium]